MNKETKDKIIKEIKSLIWAIVIVIILRAFVVQAYKIPSGSMIPTLVVGDHLLAGKFTYGIKIPYMDVKFFQWRKPKKGEIVIFEFPLDPSKDFVKRVVGTEGDTVEMKAGVLYINGKKIPVKYVSEYDYNDTAGNREHCKKLEEDLFNHKHYILWCRGYEDMRDYGPYVVPKNSIFVMGDNRDHSNDSRFWGPVPLVKVKGTPWIVYFPWDSSSGTINFKRFFYIPR